MYWDYLYTAAVGDDSLGAACGAGADDDEPEAFE